MVAKLWVLGVNSSSSVSTVKGLLHVNLWLQNIFEVILEHDGSWLSVGVLEGSYKVNRNSCLVFNRLELHLEVLYLCLSNLDPALVGEDNNLVSLAIQFSELLGHRLVPEDPVISIARECSSALSLNQSPVHVKRGQTDLFGCKWFSLAEGTHEPTIVAELEWVAGFSLFYLLFWLLLLFESLPSEQIG